jgi:hypothetical protein
VQFGVVDRVTIDGETDCLTHALVVEKVLWVLETGKLRHPRISLAGRMLEALRSHDAWTPAAGDTGNLDPSRARAYPSGNMLDAIRSERWVPLGSAETVASRARPTRPLQPVEHRGPAQHFLAAMEPPKLQHGEHPFTRAFCVEAIQGRTRPARGACWRRCRTAVRAQSRAATKSTSREG